MAKKSSTIHVENFVWECFEKYQEDNGITSRNTAIECLIAEYKALKGTGNVVRHIEQTKSVEKDKPKHNPIADRIKQMEDDMPD